MTRAEFLQKGHGKTGPWVDLVNSEEWDTYGLRTDHLEDPGWPRYFLKQWGFAAPRGQAFPMMHLRSLRTTLRKSCEALSAGRPIAKFELRGLNGALKVSGKHRISQRHNGLQLRFAPVSSNWDWIVGQAALSFAEVLSRGDAGRIRICENDGCRWIFYDKTKSRSRRWCSDKVCGNRERVRRSRARHSH